MSANPDPASGRACPALGSSSLPPAFPRPPSVTWPARRTGNSPREGGGEQPPRPAGRRGRVSAAPTAPAWLQVPPPTLGVPPKLIRVCRRPVRACASSVRVCLAERPLPLRP